LAAKFADVADDPKAVRALGIAEATRLAQRLVDEGVPGLHFITFNFSKATREVMAGLSLPSRV
jgi:methylenetetrahydrofolate reductase (NADPH)